MRAIQHVRGRLLLAAGLLAVLCQAVLAAPAMAAPATTAPRTWRVMVSAETPNHAIQGMAFLPGTVWINAGDTIAWKANAGEIHTVTFLATGQALPPFNPADPTQILPQGGSVYNGTSYFNSGVMSDQGAASGFPAASTYSLTFGVPGDFVYYCLVHGTMMQGLVHVRPAGTRYPYSQEQYNHQIAAQTAAIIRDGKALWAETGEDATNHLVFAGADDGFAMIMRWINSNPTVHVGQSITFKNVSMAEPHTVTFGPEQGNIFVPYGDPTNFTGQPLNSGLFLPGATFTVTFKKAGTFAFFCGLHDYMGMVGTVRVVAD
jgi:plastocyanin